MDHRHFEEWLLNSPPLAPDQRRALDAHLRTCKTCSALAEVNLALQRVAVVNPASGFANRFQARLEVRRAEQKRRMVLGIMALVLGSLGFLIWLIFPFLSIFQVEPSQLFVLWISNLTVLFTSAQTFGQVGSVMLKVVSGLVPSFMWMIVFSAVAGSATLWSFTLWKTTKVTRHV